MTGQQPQLPGVQPWDKAEDAPGGDRARAKGCQCPIDENGQRYRGLRGWIIVLSCPVHAAPKALDDE